MLRIRIVSTSIVSASIALACLMATSAAMAQTAPSKPLSLLAGLTPPHEHTTHRHKSAEANTAAATRGKVAAHKDGHRKLAARTHHGAAIAKAEPAEPIQSATQADQQPAPDAMPPREAAVPLPAPPQESGQANEDGLAMNEMIVGGQTVKIASPDQVNDIDLAADDNNTAVPVSGLGDTSNPAPPAHTVYAAPISKETPSSPVGSASWIEQVLAAFGGAVTAGVVAWFLIGSGPQRLYG